MNKNPQASLNYSIGIYSFYYKNIIQTNNP